MRRSKGEAKGVEVEELREISRKEVRKIRGEKSRGIEEN